jgi:hypothetical protein
MSMLEQVIPPALLGEYLTILLKKVSDDRSPSIPMLRRIQASPRSSRHPGSRIWHRAAAKRGRIA